MSKKIYRNYNGYRKCQKCGINPIYNKKLCLRCIQGYKQDSIEKYRKEMFEQYKGS